jgi:hypothetical protein
MNQAPAKSMSGAFLSTVTYPKVSDPFDVAIAVMNGNHLPDLIAADRSSVPKGPRIPVFRISTIPVLFLIG